MDQYLSHHGIVGMHWGIRRYQNPDGSLTPAGRKRYDVDSKKLYKAAERYQNAAAKRDRAEQNYLKKSHKGFGFTTDKDIKRAAAKYVHKDEKAEKLLRKYNKQYQKMSERYWSKNVSDISKEEVTRGRMTASKIAIDAGAAKLKDLPKSTIDYGEELLKKKK